MVMTCEQAHHRGDAEQDNDYQPLDAAVMPVGIPAGQYFDPVVPERGDDPQSSRGQRYERLQPYQNL